MKTTADGDPVNFSTHNLQVAIGGKRICDDLNIVVEPGQCWGILGCNGVGKTTLLHTLGRLHKPESGECNMLDRPFSKWSQAEFSRTVGVLLQRQRDHFPTTVLDAVLIGRHPHLGAFAWESEDDIRLAREALAAVDLEAFEKRHIQELSGGERRRVAIATLLAQAPQIFLLDEPSNHLDMHYQIRCLEVIIKQATNREGAVIMTMHDINLAARFCDHLLMLFGDGEALFGPTNIMLGENQLDRLYRHPIIKMQTPHGVAFLPR